MWETMSEINNDYFTVEKSLDLETWQEIQIVEGAGSSQNRNLYEIKDANPSPGISYYRLKQTDFDGTTKHLSVQTAYFNKANLKPFISPNPASQHVVLNSLANEVQLFDLQGNDVTSKVTFTKVSDVETKIDISLLSSGVYIIRNDNYSIRLMKN